VPKSGLQFESLLDDIEVIVRSDPAIFGPDEEQTVVMLDEGEFPVLILVPLFKPIQNGVDLVRGLSKPGIVEIRERSYGPEPANRL
jgi:hypothetical protein